MTLSIIIPCYNETATLAAVIARVLAADTRGLEKDIVIIDDGSTDESVATAQAIAKNEPRIRVVLHGVNRGKGAAIRTGFAEALGEIVLVQDADLEYDPQDYAKLLEPIVAGRADIVYGSRFKGGESTRVLYFWHMVGNKLLTLLSNMLTDVNLTDMETCYKVFRADILKRITLVEDRFGFEPEITAKICRLRPHPRLYEVGVTYAGRTYDEGKKITWRDGLSALRCIVRYNLFP